MVPPVVLSLDELPLTSNGKVDRKALARLHEPRAEPGNGYVAPRTPVEAALAGLWSEVLELDRVGVHDGFLQLGGDSLQAVRLRAKAADAGYEIDPRELFQRQTIAEIAECLEARDSGSGRVAGRRPVPRRSLVAIQPEGRRAPLFCVHPSTGHVAGYLGLARELGPDQPVFGLEWGDRFGALPAGERLAGMASQYLAEVREAHPEGPYMLAGMSVGGLVAFEMACRLAEDGAEVGLLAIVDAAPEDASLVDSGHGSADPLAAAAFYGAQVDGYASANAGDGDESALEIARRLHFVPAELSDEDVRRHLEISRLALEASRAFAPRPYPGEIELFRSSSRQHSSPSLGWDRLCTAVSVHDVPASHFEILAQPAVRFVAHWLEARLATAREGVAHGA
jgi:thioesterase domain-containing protein/aryl carrier-like protein